MVELTRTFDRGRGSFKPTMRAPRKTADNPSAVMRPGKTARDRGELTQPHPVEWEIVKGR